MADIVVFGAGDIARLARRYFDTDSSHRVAAFTVDAAYRKGDVFDALPLVDFEQVASLYPADKYGMFVAISYAKMNRVRAEKYAAAREAGYNLVSYVSSRCTYLTDHPPGDNAFILEDNTVQPFVRIGSDVTLWSGNHIGHDSVIDDHCFISSHVVISGHVHVKSFCFLGVNATIRNGVTIAEASLIGAGALILKDTRPKQVLTGVRAERLAKDSDQIEL